MRHSLISHRQTAIAFWCGCLLAGAAIVQAQVKVTPPVDTKYDSKPGAATAAATVQLSNLPNDARGFARKLGTRLLAAGQERSTYVGVLSKGVSDSKATGLSATDSMLTVVFENTGKISIATTGVSSKTVAYDGATVTATTQALTQDDSDLLETLLDDAPETFFVNLSKGAPYRFLGSRFRTDGGKDKEYQGPWYDIYQTAVGSTSSKGATGKLYYFDSVTGLPVKVRYLRADSIEIEVQYSNWRVQNGESFPGKIVRLAGGKTQFTMTYSATAIAAAATDSTFRLPVAITKLP